MRHRRLLLTLLSLTFLTPVTRCLVNPDDVDFPSQPATGNEYDPSDTGSKSSNPDNMTTVIYKEFSLGYTDLLSSYQYDYTYGRHSKSSNVIKDIPSDFKLLMEMDPTIKNFSVPLSIFSIYDELLLAVTMSEIYTDSDSVHLRPSLVNVSLHLKEPSKKKPRKIGDYSRPYPNKVAEFVLDVSKYPFAKETKQDAEDRSADSFYIIIHAAPTSYSLTTECYPEVRIKNQLANPETPRENIEVQSGGTIYIGSYKKKAIFEGIFVQIILFHDLSRQFKELNQICDKSTDFNQDVGSGIELIKGEPGEKGDRGRRGKKGTPGDITFINITPPPPDTHGYKGEPGEVGKRGRIGDSGRDGDEGPRGARGARGKQGIKGNKGVPGLKGETGKATKGEMGAIGMAGNDGVRGHDGLKGEKGEKGFGVKGDMGDRGKIGLPGIHPEHEEPEDGKKGQKGEAGVNGTPGDILEVIGPTGPRGEPGKPGVKGIHGIKGATGLTGSRGRRGQIGATGSKGVQGDKGESGDRGHTGSKGEPGTDGTVGIKGDPGIRGPPGYCYVMGSNEQEISKENSGSGSGSGMGTGSGLETGSGDYDVDGGFLPVEPRVKSKHIKRVVEKVISPAVKGEQGSRGKPGIQGSKGEVGDTGDKGNSGAKGLQGETGLEGTSGATGSRGIQGMKGDRGYIGLRGFKGKKGAIGLKGESIKGKRGSPGRDGERGPAGILEVANGTVITGPKGDRGPRGYTGEQGDRGRRGDTGKRGQIGMPGFPGDIGEPGIVGPRGLKGDKGVSRRGLKGDQGTPGVCDSRCNGVKDTDDGDAGKRRGDKGQKGEKGIEGAEGKDGRDGRDGKDGRDGEHGRDGTGSAGSKGVKGEPGELVTTDGKTVLSSKGSKGDQGDPGVKGEEGRVGAEGKQGVPGISVKGEKGDSSQVTSSTDGLCSTKIYVSVVEMIGQGRIEEIGKVAMVHEVGVEARVFIRVSFGWSELLIGQTLSDNDDVGAKDTPVTSQQLTTTPVDTRRETTAPLDTPRETTAPIVTPTAAPTSPPGPRDTELTTTDPASTTASLTTARVSDITKANSLQNGEGTSPVTQATPTTVSTTTQEETTTTTIATTTTEPGPTVHPRGNYLHMIAANKPYRAKQLKGLPGANHICRQQAIEQGFKGKYRAFLAGRHQTLLSLIHRPADRLLPIVNREGEQLFDSWNSLFDGKVERKIINSRFYSFDGRDVLKSNKWPIKLLWHGSDSIGRQDSPRNTCNYWSRPRHYQRAYVGRLGVPGNQSPSLLGQKETKCNRPLVLMCIEAYSLGNSPTRNLEKPWFDVLE